MDEDNKVVKAGGSIIRKLKKLDTGQDGFYKKPWFWLCMTVIIYCLTRPHVKVICGNGNGNGCSGNSGCGNKSET